MKKLLLIGAPAAAVALAAGIGLGTSAAQATTPPATVTASTAITQRPDGGDNGNWAQDNYTRVATIHRTGQVGLSNCPGSTTGKCYAWTFKLADSGHFTTEPAGGPAAYSGQSPRTGATLVTQVTGTIKGGTTTGAFFTDQLSAPCTVSGASCVSNLVNTAENDNDMVPTGEQTTGNWVEQFFPGTAVFNSAANPGAPDLGNWSWSYVATFGTNKQCPNDAYKWVDSSSNAGGSLNTDGDILAPDAAHCT